MVLMCCLDIGVCVWGGGCDRLCVYAGGGDGDNFISANQSFAMSAATSSCSTKKDGASAKFDFMGAAEWAKQVDGQREGGLPSGHNAMQESRETVQRNSLSQCC